MDERDKILRTILIEVDKVFPVTLLANQEIVVRTPNSDFVVKVIKKKARVF